ncbi:TPA: tetratricopeptide repeat protein [Bacillus cereus]
MSIDVVTMEEMKKLLHGWNCEIRLRNIAKAKQHKETIEYQIDTIKDLNIKLHYALINLRYSLLFDEISGVKESFKLVQSFSIPNDSLLTYYYYCFKALHDSAIGDYSAAKKSYYNAEKYLEFVQDEIEIAEFLYKKAIFYWQVRNPLQSIDNALQAIKLFERHLGYEISIAGCENVLGLSYNTMKQYEKAEEHFLFALDKLNKTEHKNLILKTRQNLGLLYADQDMSELAIRHLSEVIKCDSHGLIGLPLIKAKYLLARENFKLGQKEIVKDIIQESFVMLENIGSKEYEYHFKILEAMNNDYSIDTLEKIIKEGISAFEQEGLIGYVKDYSQQIASQFYEKRNEKKAGEYYHIAYQAEKTLNERGALK